MSYGAGRFRTAQHAPHAADDVKDPTPVHRAPAVPALGALVAVALLPFLLRALILPVDAFYAASINAPDIQRPGGDDRLLDLGCRSRPIPATARPM